MLWDLSQLFWVENIKTELSCLIHALCGYPTHRMVWILNMTTCQPGRAIPCICRTRSGGDPWPDIYEKALKRSQTRMYAISWTNSNSTSSIFENIIWITATLLDDLHMYIGMGGSILLGLICASREGIWRQSYYCGVTPLTSRNMRHTWVCIMLRWHSLFRNTQMFTWHFRMVGFQFNLVQIIRLDAFQCTKLKTQKLLVGINHLSLQTGAIEW